MSNDKIHESNRSSQSHRVLSIVDYCALFTWLHPQVFDSDVNRRVFSLDEERILHLFLV
uniref:Uncharacterized protein n=1 Tax=Arundo donax TaxID=35708 RepID=A0A0A8XS06_ARUDO